MIIGPLTPLATLGIAGTMITATIFLIQRGEPFINPAGHTNTSIAILDALLLIKAPVIEVHITNIHKREAFRHESYVSKVARGVIAGCGIEGYALAITAIAGMIDVKAKG